MERRQFGKTDMQISVLGFGGAEIGFEGATEETVARLLEGALDTLQTSNNIPDPGGIDLVLPGAREQQLGVIAKRPVANVAWKESHKPIAAYHHVYWERLNKLRYDFIRDLPMEESVAHALRFTLSVPGVHTAIVGTTKPERWEENAKLVEGGMLS